MPKKEEILSRTDIEGFKGGIEVNLDRRLENGALLKEKLKNEVSQWLEQELRSQDTRIRSLARWNKQYKGKKPKKTYPYAGAANTAIPISRECTDTLVVRIFDAIFGTIKVFAARTKRPELADFITQFEDALEWWQKYIVNFRKKIFSPLLQCLKTGTGIVKLTYEQKQRAVYRYANEEEKADKRIKKYGKEKLIKDIQTTYNGPNMYPVSREDFVISSDATDIQDAFLIGFRTYKRKPEIELKVKQGFYRKEILDAIGAPDEIDETKKERARDMGKEIVDEEKGKYAIWELWFRYDVDEDGEEDDIVVTFHRRSGTIMRVIYNPLFAGYRPFISLVFYPSEYSFDGEGICEILEKLQVEIDSVHNQRLDRMTQINAPMYVVQDGSGLEDFKIAPGLIKVVSGDLDTIIKELKFSDVYPSTFHEEAMLVTYARQAVGITPAVLGQQTAERPVAKETLALIQEANKKFKFGIDNLRACISEIGMMALEMFAQYQPVYTYFAETEGKVTERTLNFPLEYLRDGVMIELAASSELLNQEIRREINMALYTLMSDYYTKLASMGQVLIDPTIPAEFKMLVIAVGKVGGKILERIIRDYNVPDAEELVINFDEVMDVNKILKMSMPLGTRPPQEQSQRSGGGKPPQGTVRREGRGGM